MGRLALLAAIAVQAVYGLAATDVAAAAGELDPGFGTGGSALTRFGVGARAAGVALAPDGRLVIAGDVRGSAGEGTLAGRFGPAGAADPSFAGTGARSDRFGASAEVPQRGGAVLVQPDGGVVVAGVAYDQMLLARYLPDGLLDGLFGAGGITLRDPAAAGAFPDGAGPAAIAQSATGHIVVAGSAGVPASDPDPYDDEPAAEGEQIVVGRYTDRPDARGAPDPSFGRDGFTLLQLGQRSPRRPASSSARAMALQADGAIVIAGRATDSSGSDRAFVARLTPAGRLDRAFGREGRTFVQLGRRSAARRASSGFEALAQRAGGVLVAAGRATDVAGEPAVVLARFSAAGAADAGFGRDGGVRWQLGDATATSGPQSLARALVPTPDGATIVAGAASGAGAFAARFATSNGRLDCGFGRGGRAAAFGGRELDPATDGAAAALLQADGALVLAGRRPGGGLLLARMLAAAGAAPSPVTPAKPRLVTLRARYTGAGRGYAYGLVNGFCGKVDVRFGVTPDRGAATRTRVQPVLASAGPQVVCAPLRGLRPGRRYRIRLLGVGAGNDGRGPVTTLRPVRTARRALAQDGCA